MKPERHFGIKMVSPNQSHNTSVFISVVLDDPELLHAAQLDGFEFFSKDDDSDCTVAEAVTIGDGTSLQTKGDATNMKSDGGDILSSRTDTDSMNDITREELKDTLSGIEDRMDKRIERMEKDSEKRSEDLRREMRLRERSARRESIAMKEALQAHISSNDRAVTSTLSALERTEAEFGKVKQANKEQRYWMAGIGVAIVLGIMGANATIFGGGKAFFDGGKDAVLNQQKVDSIIKQAQEQTEANRRILDEIRAAQLAAPKKQS